MKRILLFASAILGSFTGVCAFAGGPEMALEVPDYFSGFFVGGTGAFHMAAFEGNSSIVAPQDVVASGNIPFATPLPISATIFTAGTLENNDINGNAFQAYYGVQGGVGKVFDHRWYTGFVGFGEWGSQSDTSVTSAQYSNQVIVNNTPFPNQTANGQYTSSTTVKISNDYGVAFKPGFLVAPRSMVYGKIGPVWANLQVSNTVSGTSVFNSVQSSTSDTLATVKGTFSGSSSNKDNKTGLLLGVGFEQFIYSNFLTFNIEYNYVNYGHVDTTTNIAAQGTATANTTGQTAPLGVSSGLTAQTSADARVSSIVGGLNFYFGSRWF